MIAYFSLALLALANANQPIKPSCQSLHGNSFSCGSLEIDGAQFVRKIREFDTNSGAPSAKLNAETYNDLSFMKDPWSDPENPRVIEYKDVLAARENVKGGIQHTPCTYSNLLSKDLEMEIYFKKDFLQVTGSFKERGALNTLFQLSPEQKQKGVIAASAGNHALGLAYHGQNLGVPVTVVMPIIAPLVKVATCRRYGANVIVKGADLSESKAIAMQMADEQGLLYVNGYDHPHILAGQGTMGLEIFEDVPNVDAVIISVGGGGLIAGSALALKTLNPNITIIGVESVKCASFARALEAGKPVVTPCGSTISDGLSVPEVGINSVATVIARKLIDRMVNVTEEELALAVLRLTEREKAVVEGAGAAGLAAVIGGKVPELKGKRVVIALSGGNIDTTVLGRSIDRALASDRRLVRFSVIVKDKPGGLAELNSLLAMLGVSIRDIGHERAWIKDDIFNVRVVITAETRDKEHAAEVEKKLHENYDDVVFDPPIAF